MTDRIAVRRRLDTKRLRFRIGDASGDEYLSDRPVRAVLAAITC